MSGKELDKLFADKLKEHQVKPSSNAWQRIESQIAKPKKRPVAWWKWTTLGLLITGGTVWAGMQHPYFNQAVSNQSTEIHTTTRVEYEIKQEPEKTELATTNTEIIDDSKSEVTVKTTKSTIKELTTKKDLKLTNNKLLTAVKKQKNKLVKPIITKITNKHIDDPVMPDINVETSLKDDITDSDLSIIAKKEPVLDSLELTTEHSSQPKEPVVEEVKAKEEVKEKRKRIKVEIKIPPRKRRKAKGGQQNQGISLKFKSVLHNVFANN